MTLRELMTEEVAMNGWLDYSFNRSDDSAKKCKSYKNWLNHLSDEDFLAAYNRVREAESKLD